MTSPRSLCGIGITGTNRAQIWAVSGRRTGMMSNACAENSTSHTEWCVDFTTSIHSLLTLRRMLRSTCQETIGSEYLNLRSEHGRRATHRTPMSAATRMHNLVQVVSHQHANSHLFLFSEIKFGALFDHLPEGTDFLATGRSPLSLLTVLCRSM